MTVIIRDGSKLSTKAEFVAEILRNSSSRFLYVFRKEEDKFKENWYDNEFDLATSTFGILIYYMLLFFLKSPKDLHDGVIRRLRRGKLSKRIRTGNSVTILLDVFYQYFARSARADRLKHLLKRISSKKVFLIDEFFSLKTVNLRMLKKLGPIIYLSSDVARDFYGNNLATSRIMSKFERRLIALPDMVIACSERDRLKYIEMGAGKAVYYPNIYPVSEFEPLHKDQKPSIALVLREHWGSLAKDALEEVFKALGFLGEKIRIYLVGMKPKNVPENVELYHYDYIQSRSDFLKILSKSWFGINIGIHSGGSNQRKFDYALAQLVVFSDYFGARGDLLPCEYTYVDHHDLAAKLKQLLEMGKEEITFMGAENRKQALSLAYKQRDELQKAISNILQETVDVVS